MWQSLHDAWWRLATQTDPHTFPDALAARALQAGSVVYRAAVALRNTAYERGWAAAARLPCRVVSVGNLTVGGTGKTACVELIARKLCARGAHVAILSRGYGGRRRDHWMRWETGRLTVDGQPLTDDRDLADEPRLLARHLEGVPVVVGSRRDRTGRWACATFNPDVAILDDGFQHRRLGRDCDVVLVHARMPFGGWELLPRGPMREPLESLRRAHIVIMTKADEALERLGALTERLRSLNPGATFLAAVHEPVTLLDGTTGESSPPSRLNGMRVGLLSSIGDPAGFEATVQRLHATVLWHRACPDHHPYGPADWAALCAAATSSRPEAVLTTEKDWVRLAPHAAQASPLAVPLWILRVEMKVLSGERELDARLAGLCAR